MNYQEQKAKRAYELYLQGLPFKKVYAAVEKDGKYLVLKNAPDRKFKYQISGGGVDDGEDNETAIKRELREELNVNVEIVKSLGVLQYVRTWKYQDKVFDIDYESEIFLTKFLSYSHEHKFGLDGEFIPSIGVVGVAEISKEEMLKGVYEFADGGIKLD